MSTATGMGGMNFMMSSGNGISSSSSSSSSSSFGSNMSGNSGGGISYSMRDPNNYSISRSDLPFNWSRVFINDDLVTLVFKNGDVILMPISMLDASQLDTVNSLKREVADMQRTQSQQFTNTMQNAVNMVPKIFNSIMSRFPSPPDYQSTVGNMFGSNFPFGSNNSPFNNWPFSNGAGAMAYATRR